MDIEGQVAMRSGLEERARDISKVGKDRIVIQPYVAGNGIDGARRQIKQFYSVLKEKPAVDLIIIQPTDNSALTKPLKLANKLGIPVIAYDQYILGGQLESFITSNNYQAGKLSGEYISTLYANDYTIRLIIVEYPQVTSAAERVEGFIDALKKSGQKYQIIATYSAVEPVKGKYVGDSILKKFPLKNSIDVVFTINDGGGLPIVNALNKANRNEIKIASIDGDPASIRNIISKNLTVINSAQFCSEIGRESMQAAYDFLKGTSISKKILIPTFPVTTSTVKKFTGWRGPIPKEFNFPWNNSTWNNKVIRTSK